jgi:hypothetical protein
MDISTACFRNLRRYAEMTALARAALVFFADFAFPPLRPISAAVQGFFMPWQDTTKGLACGRIMAMQPGDEGKPMSVMEFITDEPRDVEPYIEYLLKDLDGRIAYWTALPNDRDPDKPTARECVLHWFGSFKFNLEDILLKLRRERTEARAQGRSDMKES